MYSLGFTDINTDRDVILILSVFFCLRDVTPCQKQQNCFRSLPESVSVLISCPELSRAPSHCDASRKCKRSSLPISPWDV